MKGVGEGVWMWVFEKSWHTLYKPFFPCGYLRSKIPDGIISSSKLSFLRLSVCLCSFVRYPIGDW